MTKELTKVCKEAYFEKSKEIVYPIDDVSFKHGFQAAIKSEHVQGLLKEITAQLGKIDQWSYANNIKASGLDVPLSRIEQALEKFRGEE